MEERDIIYKLAEEAEYIIEIRAKDLNLLNSILKETLDEEVERQQDYYGKYLPLEYRTIYEIAYISTSLSNRMLVEEIVKKAISKYFKKTREKPNITRRIHSNVVI